jgi:hypothetical protein
MCVEMQDRDGPAVYFIESAEGWESDRVVPAQCEEARVRGCWGAAVAELVISGCHLGDGGGVVEGADGDVAAVEEGGPGGIGVYRAGWGETAEGGLAGAGGADGARAEASACVMSS